MAGRQAAGPRPANQRPPRRRSRAFRRAAWLLAALVVAAALAGLGYLQLRPRPPRYQLAKVAAGPASATMTLVGTVQPDTSATLTSPVAGTVSSVSASVGEQVTAGETLATVVPNGNPALTVANDQAALAAASAALSQAQSAAAAPSASGSAVSADLTEISKSCTSSQCQSALHALAKMAAPPTAAGQRSSGTTSVTALQAAVTEDQASLSAAQAAAQTASVTAPISGTVVSVDFPAGQRVAPKSKYSIIIIQPAAWQVLVNVSSANLPSLAVGDRASITAASGAQLTGSVSSLGTVPTVDAATGSATFQVTVSVAGSPRHLFDGMSAVTTIVTRSVTRATVIPTSAIIDNGSGPRVGVLTRSGVEQLVTIKLGIVGPVTSQVLSGLSTGQSVVLANLNAPLPTPTKPLGFLRKAFLGGGGKKKGG